MTNGMKHDTPTLVLNIYINNVIYSYKDKV